MTFRIAPYRILICMAFLVVLMPSPALAYIGPGAGFALAGSFMTMFAAMFSALFMILFWPFRRVIRLLFRRRPPRTPRFKRVVVLGLDGLDYGLTKQLLEEGKLPNLAALRERGDFKPLASTLPPISPVAWSSFQTGVNPGKHNIFDFLTPDEHTYRAKLSSVEIPQVVSGNGWLSFGRSRVNGQVRLLRKSKPFWSILSDYGIFNSILRIPVSFPPEKLRGVQLSAMGTPDLQGTQGTFSYYTTETTISEKTTGGDVYYVERSGNSVACELVGPPHPSHPGRGPIKILFTVNDIASDRATLKIGGKKYALIRGEHSDWIHVEFRIGGWRRIHGICRFLLLETTPSFKLYVTPVNIDPENPAMPIGYPSIYSTYLAKQQGPFATVGLAEDTWGLSEHVLEDEHFFRQCLDIEKEREAMFFDSLEKVPQGLCVCVFDGTDRMQHMFWRHRDQQHPARPSEVPAKYESVIEDMYIRMDQLVGRTMAKCQDGQTLFMVISDHGFNAFRRGIDLNRWLEIHGYLVVDDQRRYEDNFRGVDWSRTRAFALGLSGIFINRKGRFAQGIVESGKETRRLCEEIAARLAKLQDPSTGNEAITRIYEADQVYRGPYKDHAPDLIVGYTSGYRVSWDTAIGRTSQEIFAENTKAWSGDHCVDPSVVPGVLFCNHKIDCEHPRLLDLGATILEQFGVPVPEYMDGRALGIRTKSKATNDFTSVETGMACQKIS